MGDKTSIEWTDATWLGVSCEDQPTADERIPRLLQTPAAVRFVSLEPLLTVLIGDVMAQLASLPDESVQCVVTSPPYWGLRDYGTAGQIGLERTPELYVDKMVAVFRQVRRVLRDDGTCWVNMGDSYASNPAKGGSGPNGKNGYGEGYARAMRKGSGRADGIVSDESPRNRDGAPPCELPAKNLVGIPWRVAFALQADGWWLRSDIIWAKPNPMPESVTDRPTKSHEYIFLLTKSERYYFDQDAVREPHSPDGRQDTMFKGSEKYANGFGPTTNSSSLVGHERWPGDGRNIRTVWTIATQPYPDAHFATFPEELAKRCILAGSKAGDTVLDPFAGSGTTLKVAIELGRQAIGIELNPGYAKMIERRCRTTLGLAL